MDVEKFKSLCWQGDVNKAINYIKSLKSNDSETIELEKTLIERFISQTEKYDIKSDDSFIKEVVECYLSYFREVLTTQNNESAEKKLLENLSEIIGDECKQCLNDIEQELATCFKERGYSFIGGITKPYRGPYIWKTTKREEFDVSLPSGNQKVVVFFLSDFLLISWAHYASIGLCYAGGWCTNEGLYYVNCDNRTVDTDTERFKVWFLKHEAQHLSDYEKYPNLNSVNLEYRAKLIELMYNTKPFGTLSGYLKGAKKDVNLPHSYASYAIIKGLNRIVFGEEVSKSIDEWSSIEAKIINNAATELFNENEEELKLLGMETKGVELL